MSTGWNRLSAETLRNELEHCRDLLTQSAGARAELAAVERRLAEILKALGDGYRSEAWKGNW